MPLRFLRLPFLAMKVVVDLMSTDTLVRMSLQSRKTAHALKCCGKTNVSFFNLSRKETDKINDSDKIELFLLEVARCTTLPQRHITVEVQVYSRELHLAIKGEHFGACVQFKSMQNINQLEGLRRHLRIGDRLVSTLVNDNRRIFHIFWEDRADGLNFFTEYLSRKNFNVEFPEVLFNINISATPPTDLKKLTDFLTQAIVHNVIIESVTDEDHKYIMENLSASKMFTANFRTKDYFEFPGMIKAKSILIEHGHWFTAHQLMRCANYEEIAVFGKKFKNGTLKRFLEGWEAGSYPKLKHLKVQTFIKDQHSLLTYLGFYATLRNIYWEISYVLRGPGRKYAVAEICSLDEKLCVSVYEN